MISDVDAVLIITPASTHSYYFELCARDIKNIFVEKPLAANLKQLETINNAANKYGTNVQCGFIERFNPSVKEFKKILKGKRISDITFRRLSKMNRIKDVNIIFDLMIHDIDLSLLLFGPVKKITAEGKVTGDTNINKVEAKIFHTNGIVSNLVCGSNHSEDERKIKVVTSSKTIELNLIANSIVMQDNDTSTHRSKQLLQPFKDALQAELDTFINSCHGISIPDTPDLASGAEALRICQEIKKLIRQ